MAGHTTLIVNTQDKQLLYVTAGFGFFRALPKSSITGLPIEGDFINTSFKPKLRCELGFAAELVELAGEVSTEAKIRKAFDRLKARHEKQQAAPKSGKQISLPTPNELDRARFEAAMKVMQELSEKFEVKVA